MLRRNYFKLTVLTFIFLFFIPAYAQKTSAEKTQTSTEKSDDNDADENNEKVVVTGTRKKSSWKKAPAMVTVVEKEELEQAPETTVDDFLKRIPSVSYSRIHHAECGGGRDITLRGIHDQKRTLVLLDGIPLNGSVSGAVNWSLMPKESVERIEVIRGPMSALYGSGAMGGVINIVTNKPKEKNETLLKGGYGMMNTYKAALLQGGKFGKWGYLIGGNLFKTDGYIQAKTKEDYYTENKRTDMSLIGKVFVNPGSKSEIALGANYVNEDFSRGIVTDDQKKHMASFNLSYTRDMEDNNELSASLYSQIALGDVNIGARPDYTQRDHVESSISVKVGELFKTDFQAGKYNTMTVGVDSSFSTMKMDHEYDLVEREADSAGNMVNVSLFAQDEIKLRAGKHKFYLTPGARLDYIRTSEGSISDTNPAPRDPVDEEYDARSWVAVNPKLSFLYRYSNWTNVRLSAGRSFAAPTLFEQYTVFTRGPMIIHGNPELEPETAWSAEAGIDQWFMQNFMGRATFYYTRAKNFIGRRISADDPTSAKMDNVTEVQIIGVDAELRYDINKMWSLYGGYTFNWTTVVEDETDPDIKDNHVPFVPLHRARLGLVFKYKKWITIDLSARYEGERYVDYTESDKMDDYFSLDLALSGYVTEHVNWNLSFENMLNEHYDIYSVPNIPAEAYGFLVNGYLTLKF